MCVDVPQQIKFDYRGNTYVGAFEFPREPSHYIDSICPAHTNTHTTQSTCTEYREKRQWGRREERNGQTTKDFRASIYMYMYTLH